MTADVSPLTLLRRMMSVAVLSLAFAPGVSAASFDCAKASSVVEKAVCADPALSNLDEYLGHYYGAALVELGDGASCLKADQRNWVKTTRNACGGKTACLITVYLARLATLDGLQPGASALKNVELPVAAALVAAIPAETDSVAPAGKKMMHLQGQLVHESADINNMGFAVKPAKGVTRAFVYDMSIGNSPSHETIRTLIENEPRSQFMVQGLAAADGGFSDGACRYVYRVN